MKARKKLSIALILSLIMTVSINAKDGIQFQSLSLKEGLEKAKRENKQVFIDIYATWCGPCKYLSKSVFTNDDLGEFMNENFVCLKLDGEKTDGRSLMNDFDLNSYPTMLFLSPEKKVLKKIVGAVSAKEIEETGNAVAFPENTEVFKLMKQFKAGERKKSFLKKYIEVLLTEGEDADAAVKEYLKLFPKLNLKDEQEFMIFGAGITDLNNLHSKEFISKASAYKSLHPALAEWKIINMLVQIVHDAVDQKNVKLIDEQLSRLFPTYKLILEDEAESKSVVKEALLELYKTEVEFSQMVDENEK